MTEDHHFDVVVVGAGAGGLTTALEAVRLGARVAVVEEGRIGGDCTWTGCVPSKTLLEHAARGDGFDETMGAVRDAVRRIAAREDAGVLSRSGVALVEGRGVLDGPRGVRVGGRRLTADDVVVATGARPALPPIPGLADVDVLTTDTVFDLDRRPNSMIVVGGGPTGCELAQGFARLGVDVVLVEVLDRLLAGEEPRASAVVETALAHDGVTVACGSGVDRVERSAAGARVHVGDGTFEAESMLVVAGREPRTSDLGLETVGAEVDGHGFLAVDDRQRTSAKGVWAVGDVTGVLPFTHAAHEMARVAAARIAGGPRRRFSTEGVPHVVFTDPEVARVGTLEADAPRGARVARVDFTTVDRALAAGREEGFVQLVSVPRRVLGHRGGGRLAGATIVGPRAGEMIHEAALAVRTRMFTGRLAQTVHAYPSWSMAVRQAAGQFFQPVDGREARPAGSPDS